MPKQIAINDFLNNIYTITKQQNLDVAVINIPTFDKLLVKYGLSKKDVKSYIVTETDSNIYFDNKALQTMFKEEVSPQQFLDSVKDAVMSRLPRAIQLVVKDTPLILSNKLSKTTRAQWDNVEIAISTRYVNDIILHAETNLTSLLHSIGHEYWHDFSHKTNFKENLKGMIKDKINNILQKEFYSKEQVKTVDNLATSLNFIEELTDGSFLKSIEDEYVGRWGTKYIKAEAVSFLENNLYKQIDHASIRGSVDELMADALGHIVSGTKPTITNRGVNFILQKLAVKVKVDRLEVLANAMNINSGLPVEASMAELLSLIEDCEDCGL